MRQPYSEKEVLADALTAEKTATDHYNTFANECVHENVRNAILDCLDKEHAIQQDVFNIMHGKGYYPTPAAEMQKVDEAKQKYSQCMNQDTKNQLKVKNGIEPSAPGTGCISPKILYHISTDIFRTETLQ